MAKVMFSVSYDINPEKREEYAALVREMKATLAQRTASYAVYEQKGKKNSFSEVFVFNSIEEYEQMEDQDDVTSSFMNRLEGMLANGKMKYSTLVEVE